MTQNSSRRYTEIEEESLENRNTNKRKVKSENKRSQNSNKRYTEIGNNPQIQDIVKWLGDGNSNAEEEDLQTQNQNLLERILERLERLETQQNEVKWKSERDVANRS
jgi:hypothetical protein